MFAAIEDVRPMTRDGFIDGLRIARMVREGDEIDGGRVGLECDVGAATQSGYEPLADRSSGGVAYMEDTPA
jgi:hypothetical protein